MDDPPDYQNYYCANCMILVPSYLKHCPRCKNEELSTNLQIPNWNYRYAADCKKCGKSTDHYVVIAKSPVSNGVTPVLLKCKYCDSTQTALDLLFSIIDRDEF